jgi:hypothetical protein
MADAEELNQAVSEAAANSACMGKLAELLPDVDLNVIDAARTHAISRSCRWDAIRTILEREGERRAEEEPTVVSPRKDGES